MKQEKIFDKKEEYVNDRIIKVLEIIGTIEFSVSGALVAIGASLDIFGVVFVGPTPVTQGSLGLYLNRLSRIARVQKSVHCIT